MRSNLTDIEVYLHHETEKSWLVSTDGDRSRGVWVPKSQGELANESGHASIPLCILTAPEPLLIEKGLV